MSPLFEFDSDKEFRDFCKYWVEADFSKVALKVEKIFILKVSVYFNPFEFNFHSALSFFVDLICCCLVISGHVDAFKLVSRFVFYTVKSFFFFFSLSESQ